MKVGRFSFGARLRVGPKEIFLRDGRRDSSSPLKPTPGLNGAPDFSEAARVDFCDPLKPTSGLSGAPALSERNQALPVAVSLEFQTWVSARAISSMARPVTALLGASSVMAGSLSAKPTSGTP